MASSGLLQPAMRQLASFDLAFAYARLPVVRSQTRQDASCKSLLHLANTLLLFAVLKKMTGCTLAKCICRRRLCPSSDACRIGRVDCRTQGCFEHIVPSAYTGRLCQLCQTPRLVRYAADIAAVRIGPSGKTNARYPAVCAAASGLLAANRLYRRLRQTPAARTRKSARIAIIRDSITGFNNRKNSFLCSFGHFKCITFLVQRSGGAVADIDALPLKDRIANAFLSYARYIGKMFWPQNLAVFYPFDADSFPFWQVAMCVLLLLVISVFVIRFGRNQKYLPVGWFWFVGTLVPVIGLVQVGVQAYADRYTYIPYIGLFIMIAWGLPELLSKWPQRKIALGLSMVIVLTALGICAHRQVSYWNNSITLFSHAIEVTQNNYIAYNNLGVAYDRPWPLSGCDRSL